MKTVKTFLVSFLFANAFLAQSTQELVVTDIAQDALTLNFLQEEDGELSLQYGRTILLEEGEVKGNRIGGLEDAKFYYVQATRNKDGNTKRSATKLFSTQSKSSGDITVYFTQWVDNNVSTLADGIHVSQMEDTIVAYINRSVSTLDVCNYNTGSTPIVNAINAAKARGVEVRYIASDNTGTNNSKLGDVDVSIPMITRPNDGEVMHNKFLIIDAGNASLSTVVTGSVNHTNNSCHVDYNNFVAIEDQALALAYKTEFEEMWGSATNTPNTTVAKFGAAKSDNTPHNFMIGGKSVELYFSPSDNVTAHIESAILTANTSFEFAMLTYINNDLGDAAVTVKNAGVDVKGMIHNQWYFGSEYNKLNNAGISVFSPFSSSPVLHHKYGIIDAFDVGSDPQVITGSHNWTNSAENDFDENTLIIHDAEIANMYYEEFITLFEDRQLSVNDLVNRPFIIYPNPLVDRLLIDSKETIIKVELIDLTGKTVQTNMLKGKEYTAYVEVAKLPQGIYFVRMTFDNGTSAVEKVMKN